jgi:RNA polymerase sigma factor (TIGR02999 family)
MSVVLTPPVAPPAGGEPADAHVDALFAKLYADLCRLARREVHRNAGADMSPGTLVHEVWLDVRRSTSLAFAHPGQFLAYASRVMRGLVIDRVRRRQAQKRGGGLVLTTLDTQEAERLPAPESLEEIQLALDELAAVAPDLAQVVDLKFFCGFTNEEVATLQGVSERTVQRQWEKARTLLYCSLRDA